MLFTYNILQILFLFIFSPLILCIILSRKKYRSTILNRLGFGLKTKLSSHDRKKKKTVWIHALSVGEITSAVPLIKEMRRRMQNTFLVVSTSTSSGGKLARELLDRDVDVLFESPIDFLPVVRFFIKRIQPDIFVLVETDFWPNLLFSLKRKHIRSYLVNGRISNESMHSYRRFGFFFRPLFNTFNKLCLQTSTDKQNMRTFGIDENKLFTLGNLKYDTTLGDNDKILETVCTPPAQSLVWVCGSTHKGEEEILLSVYTDLKKDYPHLYLIIAPRNIDRALELVDLGRGMGLSGSLQSQGNICSTGFHILDTIGHLTALYQQADIAFIGGSLVESRGHNPIEAAAAGIPVLFGNHMEDFEEISTSLIRSGGAFKVKNEHELKTIVFRLVSSDTERKKIGQKGYNNILENRGVSHRHLELILNDL